MSLLGLMATKKKSGWWMVDGLSHDMDGGWLIYAWSMR